MAQTKQDRLLENEILSLDSQIQKVYRTTEQLIKECRSGKYSMATKSSVAAQGLNDVLKKLDTIRVPKVW